MTRLAAALAAAVVLMAAAGAASTKLPAASKEIADADIAFARATAERGLDGWVEFFSERAALAQFDPPAIGKEGIRRAYAPMFARKNLKFVWAPDKAEVLPQGEVGYSTGHYTLSFEDDKGVTQRRSGNYITVWQKQKDGSWKVMSDLGSVDP